MLHIAAIELHATGRHELVRRLNALVETASSTPHLIPPISIRPVAPEEAAFVHAPEVVIVGPLICEESPDSLRRFRSLFPDAHIIGMINETADQLGRAEALASRGVNELMNVLISSVQFMQRIIVLNRSLATSRRGKLILVDGAKGGVGASSVAAGLGEILALRGQSTVLVDLDNETQDLSRFLGARPFLNDTLQLILNQQSPLTEENMTQALVQVGDDAAPFWIAPPAMTPYATISPANPTGKSLLAFLQMIDTEHDYTVIDMAHAGPELRMSLIRGADTVIIVTNGVPSTLHSAAHKTMAIKSIHGDLSRVRLLENGAPHSLPSTILRSELAKMTGAGPEQWFRSAIPHSRAVAYWPGSLSTPASIGCKKTRKTFEAVGSHLIEGNALGATAVTAEGTHQPTNRLGEILAMTRRALTANRDALAVPALTYTPSADSRPISPPPSGNPQTRTQPAFKPS
jgi:Mrp family chromosome partitioning ATPase